MSKPIGIPGKFGYGTSLLSGSPTSPSTQDAIELLNFITTNSRFATKLLNDAELYVENADTFIQTLQEQQDFRTRLDKFQPETFKHNLKALRALYDFAHNEKNTSLESLALSWILKISGQSNFRGVEHVTRILPIPSGSTQKRVEDNLESTVELTDNDLVAMEKIFKQHPITGLRYNKQLEGTLFQ
ncbi:uncharacterized protein LODBEIA_P39470 [Lodderomyces beijingensis]|uniref:NADP-dependent oxidoreductase domain-containing protein n=1 Tax=Lodderomyces beijingensis TaxID=1775926 RepID=A0ABP0ZPW0_9ASCO